MNPKIPGLNQSCSVTDERHASHCVHEVLRKRIVASHTHATTCSTQFTRCGISRRRNQTISESTTSIAKRVQPLSEKSGDCAKTVGFQNRLSRVILVCFATRVCVCVPGLAGIGKAAKGILNVTRRVSENNRKLERCDRHSLFNMRAWCARMELMESLM